MTSAIRIYAIMIVASEDHHTAGEVVLHVDPEPYTQTWPTRNQIRVKSATRSASL